MEMEAWKKRRSRTIRTYLFFKTCVAIDTALISVTIIPYLKERVSGEDADYFYGLECTVGYVSSAIVAILIGRIVDRTRCVRYSLYFVLTCGAVGEILYTFRFSPYLIVAARTLCGTLPAQDYVLRGEIVRIFNEEEASKVLWWYTTAATFGYIIGSGINLLFNGIDFHIGTWRINPNNFAGVLLLALCVINILTVYFFAHDCSKEYDLKSFTDREKMKSHEIKEVHHREVIDEKSDAVEVNDRSSSIPTKNGTDSLSFSADYDCIEESNSFNQNVSEQTSSHLGNKELQFETICATQIETENIDRTSETNQVSNRHIFHILLGFIRSPDILFIMTSTFLYAGTAFATDLMSPIIILETLNWEPKYLSIQQVVNSIAMAATSLFLSKYGVSNTGVYTSSLVTILLSGISVVLLIILTLLSASPVMSVVLVVLYSAAITPLWYLDLSLFPNMLARMVKTDVQSFAESCRSVFSLSSVIIVGTFIAADGYAKYLFFGLTGLIVISVFIFLFARRRFIDIGLVE